MKQFNKFMDIQQYLEYLTLKKKPLPEVIEINEFNWNILLDNQADKAAPLGFLVFQTAFGNVTLKKILE